MHYMEVMYYGAFCCITLAAKLETTHKPAKPPTIQPNHPQTREIPDKPPTDQPNHPQNRQIPDKPPTNQPIMNRKSAYVT